ncbi:LLM class flavin-dependent oxidoreductase [Modestobacter versicolor]|uniref:Alkanesulfonate monooxygenase SsuD/methylene tetrahydromethanopterin reductase-like flavin-dependent oxidoreductase (Luciferase family) n=1 Tax=Modestobacter versicolor TaxID=429133 RepID=A0A323V4A0_9ACTN|nr:LLM class flavin-dependent oxidoreductase [Modestobacter versicolor]MBB3675144.1 alkanesulfonate monooxygenase SsuD/methylene tetrahydromethanopterin reductase-like flavin-dependent oxidoreductase (luciferase family) [Modestobacter versicolor]PZA19647.1 LLM class flavin-dependent oxidoreductase [Modestobacter versicolor]
MSSAPVPTLSALVLPDRHPVSTFVAEVQDAERFGVRAVFTYDHLTWPLLADGPWYGAVPLLAAAAAATDRVRLGTQVASPNFRHPVPFATELVTLDQLSGGRLELGVGAGTESLDAKVLGDPPLSRPERMTRFEEWLTLLDQLLREPVVTVHGERYTAIDAHQLPGCVQTPRLPFTVAATGPRALRLAARLGQRWVTYGPYGADVEPEAWFAAVAEQSARLTDALAEDGREPSSMRRSAQLGLETYWPFESRERYADTLGRLTEAGIDEVSVHWPRPDGRGVPTAALPVLAEAHGL